MPILPNLYFLISVACLVSTRLHSGKILINLQIFPRNICSLCPNIRNFRSGGAVANSCSGTLPLNILIEFVTLRLEAGHYTGEPQELQNI